MSRISERDFCADLQGFLDQATRTLKNDGYPLLFLYQLVEPIGGAIGDLALDADNFEVAREIEKFDFGGYR
ncbi:hypothetical protein X759_34420 [Mesorhizobium sp. LSHC420B00]|nr:hypothetical protein X759_34420 [Mesorhizobium sp. LSHC420B00]